MADSIKCFRGPLSRVRMIYNPGANSLGVRGCNPHIIRRGLLMYSNRQNLKKFDSIEGLHLTLLHTFRDVNETLGSETETRPRRLIFSPRRDRDRDLPTFCRDRDETETFNFWVRDETETETLRGRDRDVFRDVGTLGYPKKPVLFFANGNVLYSTSILYS